MDRNVQDICNWLIVCEIQWLSLIDSLPSIPLLHTCTYILILCKLADLEAISSLVKDKDSQVRHIRRAFSTNGYTPRGSGTVHCMVLQRQLIMRVRTKRPSALLPHFPMYNASQRLWGWSFPPTCEGQLQNQHHPEAAPSYDRKTKSKTGSGWMLLYQVNLVH